MLDDSADLLGLIGSAVLLFALRTVAGADCGVDSTVDKFVTTVSAASQIV